MAIRTAIPYLFFCGTASRAIARYESALGARVTARMNYGQGPGSEKIAAQDSDRIMHAALDLGGVQLFLSDSPASMDTPAEQHGVSNVHVSLDLDDADDMQKKFDALAQGGKVHAAIHDAFWGGKFGMLTDEFGINWMFTFTPPAAS